MVVHKEVPVRNGVHAVHADTAEPQIFGDELPVDGVRNARQSAASQRKDVGATQAVVEALPVPLKHMEVGQQMV